MAFLGFDGHGGDGAGFEALKADGLVSFFAISVGSAVDAVKGLVDFRDELAGAVAGPQFQGAVGFDAGAVGDVGFVNAAFGQAGEGSVGVAEEVGPPADQFLAEIFRLDGVHEFFEIGRPVVRGQRHHHSRRSFTTSVPVSRGGQAAAQFQVSAGLISRPGRAAKGCYASVNSLSQTGFRL